MSVVFLTGGTGFIGGALLTRLVGDGHDVRALVRSEAGADMVTAGGAVAIRGDLSDAKVLAGAMDGCARVFHVAGANELCPRSELAMFQTNVTGTRNVVAAAGAAGVERVVYTSSAVVLGEHRGTVGSEMSHHRGRYLSTYERSKHEAELVAFTAAGHHGVDVVAVNPSSVQGPGRVEGSARIFLFALRSKRPWLFDTSVSIVDIDDCTNAHVLASEVGTPGERYVVSGATLSVSAAVATVARVAGVEAKPRMIPRGVVRGIGIPLSYVLRYVPTSIRICPEMLKVLLHGHSYDGTKATRALGLEYTPVDETIGKTVDWYRHQGMV